MKMKKITFIMRNEGDFKLMTDSAPSGKYQLSYLSNNSDNFIKKADAIDKTGMFIWIHDVTGGRVAPDQLESEILEAEVLLGRNVNGLVVLFAEGSGGYDLQMTSVNQFKLHEAYNNNEYIRSTYGLVGFMKIADKDRFRLWTVLEKWYDEIPQAMLLKSSITKPAPSKNVESDRTADQATMRSQQQRIEFLEEQVRSLTERLVTVERQLQIKPSASTTTSSKSSQGSSRSFF